GPEEAKKTPRPVRNDTEPVISRMIPTVLMLKPLVVTETANARMAPTTTRAMPRPMRPVPVALFMVHLLASLTSDLPRASPRRNSDVRPRQFEASRPFHEVIRRGVGFEVPATSERGGRSHVHERGRRPAVLRRDVQR